MHSQIPLDGRSAKFGQYQLSGATRRLRDLNGDVRIGGRTMDLLLALVERPGELVSKEELMQRVWPDIFVDETNLRVQMAALRRRLGGATVDRRVIETVMGRGYVFVLPVEFEYNSNSSAPMVASEAEGQHVLINDLPLVGRDEVLLTVKQLLHNHRLVTIVGPPGVGKTAVAQAVASQRVQSNAEGVWFVDWSCANSMQEAASAFARTVGLHVQPDDAILEVVRMLHDRRALIVFDNCEHILAVAGEVVRRVLSGASQVKILATSREALGFAGERPYLLGPLECPPLHAELTADQTLVYPAAQLFIERAAATKTGFTLHDSDAACLADICNWLEGLPLPIEMMAARADVLGLRGLAMWRAAVLAMSRRGCPATVGRHCSITEAFDWSFNLLHPADQRALLRISTFDGAFGLEEATQVAASEGITSAEVLAYLCSLYDRSLIISDSSEGEPRFRLLTPLREYARAKLEREGDETESTRLLPSQHSVRTRPVDLTTARHC